MSATHYIHIGRNKCASTTLQYFFLNDEAALERSGLDYFVFGQMADSFPNTRGLRTPAEYRAHITENPSRSTVISNEDLMGPLARTHAAPMLEALGEAPRRVIAYIREYNSWVRSTYMEAVMTGRTTLDFDCYLRQTEFSISAMNALKLWGKHAGWQNMYVRSLDRAGLYKGDVLFDCAQVIGVDEEAVHQRRPEPQHVSPHWMCVEIVRFLRSARTQADWRSFTHDIIYPLRPLIEAAIEVVGVRDHSVHYATLEQAERIHALYNADVAKLSELGAEIPAAKKPTAARDFLPTVEHVPIEVLRALMALAEEHYQDVTTPAHATLRKAFRWARPPRTLQQAPPPEPGTAQ